MGTLLLLDVLPAPPRVPSTEEWYKTAAVQMAFFVIWVMDMEDLFVLAFVFVLRPLLKYKRLRAVAEEDEEVFTPSLSELLEPPEYKSPIPFGRSFKILDLICWAGDRLLWWRGPAFVAGDGDVDVIVVKVDSAELLADSEGR